MNKDRLMELAGIQLNEYGGIEVKTNKDTISTLREKLKMAGVNTSSMSDMLILKFANAMKDITIENLNNKSDVVISERMMELAGILEYDGMEVKHNNDTISSLRDKLKQAGVNVSNMSDMLILKFANAMKEITIEANKNGGKLVEGVTSISWFDV